MPRVRNFTLDDYHTPLRKRRKFPFWTAIDANDEFTTTYYFQDINGPGIYALHDYNFNDSIAVYESEEAVIQREKDKWEGEPGIPIRVFAYGRSLQGEQPHTMDPGLLASRVEITPEDWADFVTRRHAVAAQNA